MRHYFIYILISGCISCKDLIETDYPSNQVGSNQVFNDVHTANSAPNNLSFFSGIDTGSGILIGSYTHDIDCYYSNQNGSRDIYLNQQHATNSKVELS